MKTAVSGLCRLIAFLALIVAMATAGVAHSAARPALSPDLAAYVASGGSLSDICGGADGQDSATGGKCELCRLIGAAVIPRDCDGFQVVLFARAYPPAIVSQGIRAARPLDPARLTRAPPKA